MSRSNVITSSEDQANSLVQFLSDADHHIAADQVTEICRSLSPDHKVAARQLKQALQPLGVELKHTHALKAITQMRHAQGFLGSADSIRWDIASWIDDAPAVSPRREQYLNLGKACDQLCERIREQFERDEEPLVRLRVDAHSVEVEAVGGPNKGWRALLVATGRNSAPCDFGFENQLRLGERLRRLVEGERCGWLDGVACPDVKAGRFRDMAIAIDGQVGEPCKESEILYVLMGLLDDDSDLTNSQSLTDSNNRRIEIVVQSQSLQWEPVSESIWRDICSRYNAFGLRHQELFREWVGERHDASSIERFAPETLNVPTVEDACRQMKLSDTDVAAALGLDTETWRSYKSAGQLPIKLFSPLCRTIGLDSENDLLGEAAGTIRIPLPQHEDISMFVSRFETVEVMASIGATELTQRLDRLCTTPFPQRQRWGKHPSKEIEVLNQRARDMALIAAAMVEKQFVFDLPLGRSRYGLVLVLAWINESDVDAANGPLGVDNAETSFALADDSAPISVERLTRFNDQKFTGEELLKYSEKVQEMRDPDGDDSSKFHTTIFAAYRVFGKSPGKALAASVRMEAVSRLLNTVSLEPWVLRSTEEGASMLSRPVFEAAARCPLVDIQGDPGFEPNLFRQLVVQHVRTWEK